jgi:hypothetical protein
VEARRIAAFLSQIRNPKHEIRNKAQKPKKKARTGAFQARRFEFSCFLRLFRISNFVLRISFQLPASLGADKIPVRMFCDAGDWRALFG